MLLQKSDFSWANKFKNLCQKAGSPRFRALEIQNLGPPFSSLIALSLNVGPPPPLLKHSPLI